MDDLKDLQKEEPGFPVTRDESSDENGEQGVIPSLPAEESNPKSSENPVSAGEKEGDGKEPVAATPTPTPVESSDEIPEKETQVSGEAVPVEPSDETSEEEAQISGEPSSLIGTLPELPGIGRSGYIAVGALLAAVVLVLLRTYSSRKKNSASKNSSAQKRRRELSDGCTEGTEASFISDMPEVNSSPSAAGTSYSVGKVHAIGARRDQQDSFILSDYMDRSVVRERGLLAIVADGMGGLSNGGMVSKLAADTGMEYFYNSAVSLTPQRRLLEMAQIINSRVNQFLQGRGERSGSTLVEALIHQGKLYFLTVGDSRIYLYRGGHLICLNRPHVYAEELALEGVNRQRGLSDMDSDRQKDSLTSYLGAGRLKHVDRNAEGITLSRGDRIMLCSDGVFGTLNEESMEQALSGNPQEAAELLEQQICAVGKVSQDNFTAVIIQYH